MKDDGIRAHVDFSHLAHSSFKKTCRVVYCYDFSHFYSTPLSTRQMKCLHYCTHQRERRNEKENGSIAHLIITQHSESSSYIAVSQILCRHYAFFFLPKTFHLYYPSRHITNILTQASHYYFCQKVLCFLELNKNVVCYFILKL